MRAVSKTQLYETDAKNNAGLGDEILLRGAIQAWTDYKNYAAGIGSAKGQQRADRELDDLEAKQQ